MTKKRGTESASVLVLFVTLDPERHAPGILKRYLAAFNLTFVGLTGTTAPIGATAGKFFVQYARVARGNDYSIDHSTDLFVLDDRGKPRLLGTLDTSVDDITHDLTVLDGECIADLRADGAVPAGPVVSRIAPGQSCLAFRAVVRLSQRRAFLPSGRMSAQGL